MVLIYPDTNIWAYLSQQGVKEEEFASALKTKNASLVLSAHAVYELARTFVGKAGSPVGVKLFSTIKKLMEVDIFCSNEIGEFLKEECYAYENHLAAIDPLLNEDERVAIGWLGHRCLDCFLSEADFALLACMGQRQVATGAGENRLVTRWRWMGLELSND